MYVCTESVTEPLSETPGVRESVTEPPAGTSGRVTEPPPGARSSVLLPVREVV